MALIDVDRHILSELIDLRENIKTYSIKFKKAWKAVQEVKEHTDVLLFVHPDGCEGIAMGGNADKRTPQCAKRKEILKKERDKIFRAAKQIDKYTVLIDNQLSQQDALLMYLVSLVKEADTQKGTETYNKGEVK